MNRKAVIGLVAILDVAMLVATTRAVSEISGSAGIDAFKLSAETPELELEPLVTLGKKTEDNGFTVSVELSVENEGGAGWLLLYDLPPDWDGELPASPVASVEVKDGSSTPYAFDPVLSVDVERADLEDLHLLVVLDGDAVVTGDGELVVTTQTMNEASDDNFVSVTLP